MVDKQLREVQIEGREMSETAKLCSDSFCQFD
jgi:hypothetical protein